jgi:sugar lactone lactonase YvrE
MNLRSIRNLLHTLVDLNTLTDPKSLLTAHSLLTFTSRRRTAFAVCGAAALLISAGAALAVPVAAPTGHFGSAETVIIPSGLRTNHNVAVDASGNVYVPNTWNHQVLKETWNGSGYTQTTIGTGWQEPWGIAIDASGSLYITDTGLNELIKLTPSPNGYTQSVIGTGFNSPAGLTVDPSGNVYVADSGNNQIVKETLSGGAYKASVLFTGLNLPCGVAMDSNGNIYIADTDNYRVLIETLSAGTYTQSQMNVPGLDMPFGVSVDQYNNVYVVDTYHNKILMETLTPSGYVQSTIPTSQLYYPDGVAIDLKGNVYISDSDNSRVIEETLSGVNFGAVNVGSTSSALTLNFVIDTAGTLGSIAVETQGATGLDFANAGTGTCAASTAYAAAATCTVNVTFTPTASGMRYGAVTLLAGTTTVATGYVYGSGTGPQVNFLPGTQNTVLSSGLKGPFGVAVDGSGNVYVADSSNYRILKESPSSSGYTQSIFLVGGYGPYGLAVDGSGNLYIADYNNSRVLKAVPSGTSYTQTTIGSGLLHPYGVAVDGNGNVYIADTSNQRILKETLSLGGYTQSVVPTSSLDDPYGVAVDANGNVYVADTWHNRVLKETWSAGNYTETTIGSGLSGPGAVAVDGNGNVFIADPYNQRIVKETPAGGSYTQSTIAFSGLSLPLGVAVNGSGNVFATDFSADQVLMVDMADAPSLSFATTGAGTTSPDSPQTVTVENIGNAALTFPIPATGANPSIAANFALAGNSNTSCIILSANSLAPATLAAETSCQLQIDFDPSMIGAISGTLAITDSTLNAAAPGYATQSISLKGSATQGTPTITWAAPAAITYGTALSATQLKASASVPGTFAYTPAAGTVLGAGSQTLSVTFTPTDTTDYSSVTTTVTLVVNQASQTISFAPSSPVTFRAAPISLIATGGASGNAVTFSVVSGPGTISGTNLTITGAGVIVVAANQAGNANYAAAAQVTASITIAQAAQTISFSPSSPVTFRAAPISLIATGGGSGNPVTFSVVSGPGTISGTNLTITGAGVIVVAANQAGNANYLAATEVTASITIAQAAQTISFSPSSPVTFRAAPISLIATGGGSGNPVTFSVVSGPGTISGTNLTITGAGVIVVAANQAGNANYLAATQVTASITIAQATPTVNWTAPAAITYGTALTATQLKATCSLPGTFTYTPAAGTVLSAGSQTLSVTFTPNDATDYTTATTTVPLVVNQGQPSITWATPAAIVYGTALGATQLNASSTVAGVFSYTPAAGTVLTVGSQTLSVTFNPNDSTDYASATSTVTLVVNKATPSISWPAPAAITYGTALGAAQLNATSTVAGTFTYSPSAGTVTAAGTQTISVTFTPTDTIDYSTATSSVLLTVNKATPSIGWPAPAAITYGTALSGTQLNATSTVAGTFAYTPATGAVLAAGSQTLTVTFTPADTTDYTTVTSTVTLTVNQATQTIAFAPLASPVTYGVSPITLSATGGASSLPVTFSVTGPATLSGSTLTITGAGTVTVTASQAGNSNYSAAKPVTESIVVNQAASTTLLTAASLTPTQTLPDLLTATVSGPGTVSGTVVFTAGGATLCTGALSAGVATCSYAPASAGTVSVSAQYAGDANHQASSASLTLNVQPLYDAAISLQLASTQVVYPGATNVTVCVTAAGNAAATGSVGIYDGASLLTTQVLAGNGCAYWYIAPGLNAGTHSIGAQYSGDKNNAAGLAAPVSLVVSPAPMTMEASCWNSSIPYGVNYQCNANTDSGPKSGYMTYSYDGGAPVNLPLNASGATAFTIVQPVVGTHTVVIAYPAQGNYLGQTLPADTFTVRPAPVSVSLVASAYSATAGTAITFTASVTSGTTSAPSATGSVSFTNGSTLLATVPVNANGQAIYSTGLPAGNNTITATFAGAANYGTASATASIAVTPASQTITFTGLPSTVNYSSGLSYTLTATASSGLPVSYAVTGPATLSGTTLAITGAGTVTVTASQAGNSNYAAAKPVKLTISVGNAVLPSASISLQFASTTLVYPGATNVTVCVTSAKKTAATGTVQILDGATVLTTQTLQGNGCAYWYIAPALAVGTHVFTAAYSGDKNNAAGVSVATTLTVSPVPTSIALSAGNGSIPYGVNFKRTVTVSSNAGAPQGSITYSLDGAAPVSVALSSGNALVNIAVPAAGSHQVVIGYAQQTNYAAATSQTVNFTVTVATVSMTLTPSATSAKTGASVGFAAAVTSTSAGAPDATGSVTFLDGTTKLATVAVDANGKASYSTTSLAVGSHTITANYAGSSNYGTASASTKVNITK